MGLKSTFLTGCGKACLYMLSDMPKVLEDEEEEAWLMIHAASWTGKAPRGHSQTPDFSSHLPLTGLSSARARWLNPESAGGMTRSHQQSYAYYHLLYLFLLGAFSWRNQTANDTRIFLPPCQTELTETSWGFKGSQLICLARGPVSIIGTWLCSQPTGPRTHLHPPPSSHSYCCSQHPGRDIQKGMEKYEKSKSGI